jgi:hypothetical protein
MKPKVQHNRKKTNKQNTTPKFMNSFLQNQNTCSNNPHHPFPKLNKTFQNEFKSRKNNQDENKQKVKHNETNQHSNSNHHNNE